MDSEHSRGLAAFVQHLNSNPAPESVARALVLGPLARFAARSGGILMRDGSDLAVIADHASSSTLLARYSVLPLSVDVPYTRAFWRGETLVSTGADLLTDFPALALDSSLWEERQRSIEMAALVSVPISHQGVPIGAFGFMTTTSRTWGVTDFVLLDALAAVIGLWITHPASGLTHHAPPGHPPVVGDTLQLTPRQLAILGLVSKDKTNDSIAASLDVSVSTVKQEVQRLLRALRSTDRHGAVSHARALGLLPDSEE